MAQFGSFYEKQLRHLGSKKDSIFEPCTVLEYNPETMLAYVYGLHSKQYRNDVSVLFPALYLNSGVISPPAKDSTGLLFWGSENQPFLLPAQFLPPVTKTKDGVTEVSGSPARVDESFSLGSIEGGEHFIRSLGGSYFFVNNLGQATMGTSKLHKVTLSDADGSLEILVDRQQSDIGGHRYYSGPVLPSSTDHHVKEELDDETPVWDVDIDNTTLTNDIIGGDYEKLVDEKEFAPIYKSQMGNVYDDDGIRVNSRTNPSVPLFLLRQLFEKDGSGSLKSEPAMQLEIGKDGIPLLEVKNENYSTEVIIKAGRIEFVFTDRNTNEKRVSHFGFDI